MKLVWRDTKRASKWLNKPPKPGIRNIRIPVPKIVSPPTSPSYQWCPSGEEEEEFWVGLFNRLPSSFYDRSTYLFASYHWVNDIFATNRLQQSLTWLQNHPFIDGHSISISFPRDGGFSIASYLTTSGSSSNRLPIGHNPLVCCVTRCWSELSPLQAVSSCSEVSCTCRDLQGTVTVGNTSQKCDLPASSTGKTTGLVPHRSANPLTPCSLTGLAMDPPRTLGSRKFSSKSQSCNDDSLDGETFPCSKNFFEFFPFQGLSP